MPHLLSTTTAAILLTAALLVASPSRAAAAVTVGPIDTSTLNNLFLNVSTVTGTLSALNALLASQPWYGNVELANAAAQALGAQLGTPNAGTGPIFVTSITSGPLGPVFDGVALTNGVLGTVGGATQSLLTNVFATGVPYPIANITSLAASTVGGVSGLIDLSAAGSSCPLSTCSLYSWLVSCPGAPDVTKTGVTASVTFGSGAGFDIDTTSLPLPVTCTANLTLTNAPGLKSLASATFQILNSTTATLLGAPVTDPPPSAGNNPLAADPPSCAGRAATVASVRARGRGRTCRARRTVRRGGNATATARAGFTVTSVTPFTSPSGAPVTINITGVLSNRAEVACACRPTARDACACVPDAVVAADGASVRLTPQPKVKGGAVFRVQYQATSASGETCVGTVDVCFTQGRARASPPPACGTFASTNVVRDATKCAASTVVG